MAVNLVYYAWVGLSYRDPQTGEEARSEIGEEVPSEVIRSSPWLRDRGQVVAAEVVEGISTAAHFALVEAGYLDGASLASATDDELLAVDGIGPVTLDKIRGYLDAAARLDAPTTAFVRDLLVAPDDGLKWPTDDDQRWGL